MSVPILRDDYCFRPRLVEAGPPLIRLFSNDSGLPPWRRWQMERGWGREKNIQTVIYLVVLVILQTFGF